MSTATRALHRADQREQRVRSGDWGAMTAEVNEHGGATLLPRGHGYVFTTRDRPVRSVRGWTAAPVRHGVPVIRSGPRYTLGLVFHDAA